MERKDSLRNKGEKEREKKREKERERERKREKENDIKRRAGQLAPTLYSYKLC